MKNAYSHKHFSKGTYEYFFSQHHLCSINVCIHKWNENAYNLAIVCYFETLLHIVCSGMLESTGSVYFKYTVMMFFTQCLANSVHVQQTSVIFQGTSLVAKSFVQRGIHASIWPGTNHAVSQQVGSKITYVCSYVHM